MFAKKVLKNSGVYFGPGHCLGPGHYFRSRKEEIISLSGVHAHVHIHVLRSTPVSWQTISHTSICECMAVQSVRHLHGKGNKNGSKMLMCRTLQGQWVLFGALWYNMFQAIWGYLQIA